MTTDGKIIGIILVLAALLVVFPCSICYADSTEAKIGKADIAFAIQCGERKAPKLCLVGEFKAGIKVTLLQSGPRKTCIAKTTSHVQSSEEFDFHLTELSGSCDVPEEFGVAILKKPVQDYKHLIPKKIINADTISKTDRFIRNSGALLKLSKKAQDLIPGEMKELEKSIPQLYQFSLPAFNVTMALYEAFPDGPKYDQGPKVVIINKRVYPLSGWCSYKNFYVFHLNGYYYVQTGSHCCECGIRIMELFRITPNGLVEAASDSSLST
jgi:hypothetical protein